MANDQTRNIWVYVEQTGGAVHPAALELLAKAQELKKKLGEDVVAILLSANAEDDALEKLLIGHGADQVIISRNDLLVTYNPLLYKQAIAKLAKKHRPSIFLFAATTLGRSLAPRVQGALQTGLTADCLDLDIDPEGRLLQIKPSYGDNLMCTIVMPNRRPQMTTVRPSVFRPLDFDHTRSGSIIEEYMELDEAPLYEILETESIPKPEASLHDARRIVAVGRGIRQQADLKHTERLAELLGAEVGATRPLAENGWYTIDEQIGQSGTSVSPDLILNIGIAGAVQYTVGMKQAKFSFSVNKDPNAAIFRESDLGYVGDAKTLVEEMVKLLEAK